MIIPAIAILSCVIYSINIAIRSNFYFFDFIPLLFLLVINLKNLKKIFIRWIKLNGFIIFIGGGIFFFHKDLKLVKLILLRSNLIILFNLVIFSNFSPFDVYRGIIPLPIPKKLKIIFLFFIKFIEILLREYNKLQEALKIRGFKPKTNIFTYKSYAYIIAILFAKTLKKSKNLYDAITLRGFNGKIFSFYLQKIGIIDILFISCIILHSIITIIWYLKLGNIL